RDRDAPRGDRDRRPRRTRPRRRRAPANPHRAGAATPAAAHLARACAAHRGTLRRPSTRERGAAMSPGMGPVRMRSRFGRGPRKTDGNGAWELWKALPRIGPYLRPYRRRLILVVCLTVAAAF